MYLSRLGVGHHHVKEYPSEYSDSVIKVEDTMVSSHRLGQYNAKYLRN